MVIFEKEDKQRDPLPFLLLATNNCSKVNEYRELLGGLSFRVVSLSERGITINVAEIGESLEENARLKALAVARVSRLLSMSDDSGLEVDILGGEPGCLSARCAGKGANDKDRIDYLLQRLDGVPLEKRSARFRCVIAVASQEGIVGCSFGECAGLIALEPEGKGGFGYDPVFYLPELDRTMAQLSMGEKNRISHRGKAASKIRSLLEGLTV